MDIKKHLPMSLDRLVNSTFLQMSGQSEEFFARITWKKIEGVYRRVREPYPLDYLREQLAYFKVILLYNTEEKTALEFYSLYRLLFEKVDERKIEFLNGFNENLLKENIFYIINCGLRTDLIELGSKGFYKIDVNACIS